VYPQIKDDIDSVWENHVTFYDLIQGADGYSIEYQRNYYINAELRIYDEKGTYSKTDAKEIGIN
jgi:outer membrane protease